MTRHSVLLAGAAITVSCIFADATLAQTTPRQSDLAPAAPTARSGPDAGQRYEYPPNTGNIVQPANRTPYDKEPSGNASTGANPVAKPDTPVSATGR